MPSQEIKINPELIPEHTRVDLGRTLYKDIQAFYANPENMAKFREWEEKQKKTG